MTVSVAPHISGGPAQRVQELLSHPGDDFPILRQSSQGIIDCTEDDTSSANDVSEVITHDQALSTTRQGMKVGLGTHIDFSTTCAWRTTNCHFQGVNERVLPLLSSNEFFDHTGTVCQFLWSRNVVSNTTGPLSQEREPVVLLTHTPSVLHIFSLTRWRRSLVFFSSIQDPLPESGLFPYCSSLQSLQSFSSFLSNFSSSRWSHQNYSLVFLTLFMPTGMFGISERLPIGNSPYHA